MNRATEAIKKVFVEWKECPLMSVLHDCGKCPYVDVPIDECEEKAKEEIQKELKLQMGDMP